MISFLSHVAVLVDSLESVIDKGLFEPSITGEIECFPSEGTRECYIGSPDELGRLLLIQPNGDGPYRRAMEKRGPGLHHIALEVSDIEQFVRQLSGSGWYLHPMSLDYFKSTRQVFLARPGASALIEVQEQEPCDCPYFIQEVSLNLQRVDLISSLCCDRVSENSVNRIRLKDRVLNIDDLLSYEWRGKV